MRSQSALYKILDDNVANPLARVPGVGTVSISGAPNVRLMYIATPINWMPINLTIETISFYYQCRKPEYARWYFDVGSNTYSLRVEGEFNDSQRDGEHRGRYAQWGFCLFA